jgi:hypothetical protein
MVPISGLSDALKPILEFEIARGNQVVRVDSPAGTECPLAVILKLPLDIAGFQMANELPAGVTTWETRDRHYPLEAGYACERTKHALAGPAGGAL